MAILVFAIRVALFYCFRVKLGKKNNIGATIVGLFLQKAQDFILILALLVNNRIETSMRSEKSHLLSFMLASSQCLTR